MIKVATRKPELIFVGPSNDMGSFSPSEFYVSGDWFYMSLNDYMEKYEFQNFDMSGDKLTVKEKDAIAMKIIKGEEVLEADVSHVSFIWLNTLKWLLNKSKHYVWEFDAPNKDLNGWVRQIVALGQPSLIRLNWFDCYVKIPVFNFICKYLNKCLYFKRKKEIRKWQEFIKKA